MANDMAITSATSSSGAQVAIIPLSGRIDAARSGELRQYLQQILSFGYANLLLDVSAVTFLDSSGIGLLVSTLRKCQSTGGTLRLCGLTTDVQTALQVTSLNTVLINHDTTEAAIAAFP